MYRVGITGELSIFHALAGDYGPESERHGHKYRVEWILSARALDSDGFAVDISRMEAARDAALARLDGAYLNDLPFFEGVQPSLENFSAFLQEELLGLIGRTGDNVFRSEVKSWESDTAWASVEIDPSERR